MIATSPTVVPEKLKQIYRKFDDLPASVSLWGIDAKIISLAGYKICKSGYSGHGLIIARNSIILPVLSPSGAIVALHNEHGKWFTSPKVHARNLIRAQWTNRIEIFATTLEADAAAISRNVAVVALNGFAFRQLSSRLVGEAPNVIRMEAAA